MDLIENVFENCKKREDLLPYQLNRVESAHHSEEKPNLTLAENCDEET